MRLAILFEPGSWEMHNNFYANGVHLHPRRGIEKATLLQDNPDFEEYDDEDNPNDIDIELSYRVVE